MATQAELDAAQERRFIEAQRAARGVSDLDPALLQRLLALAPANYAGPAQTWQGPDGYSLTWRPNTVNTGTGDAFNVDQAPGGQFLIGGNFKNKTLGVESNDVWDASGRYMGPSSGDSPYLSMLKAAAMAVGGYYGAAGLEGALGGGAGAGVGAGSAATTGAGLTAAEQVAALQAAGLTQAEIAALVPGAMAPGTMTAAAGAAGAAGAGGGAATTAGGMAGLAKTALPWVSTAAQLYGTFAQGEAAKDAAAAQQAAAQSGITEQRRQFDLVQQLLAPYAQTGTKALGGQADLTGLNGPEAQRAAIAALEGSPQMAALMQQGENAILQNASATGGLRGGNTQAALATFRPNLLAQLIDQQYGRLGGLTSIGQNAAAGTGNAGIATGNNVTQILGQIGASQAGGALAQGATNTGYAAALAQLVGMYGGLGGATPGGTPPIAPATRRGL